MLRRDRLCYRSLDYERVRQVFRREGLIPDKKTFWKNGHRGSTARSRITPEYAQIQTPVKVHADNFT